MSRRLLQLVAEEHGFYSVDGGSSGPDAEAVDGADAGPGGAERTRAADSERGGDR